MNWGKTDWINDLRQLYPNPDEFYNWLIAANAYLNGRTPIQALFDGDEYEVAKVVDQLASDAYV